MSEQLRRQSALNLLQKQLEAGIKPASRKNPEERPLNGKEIDEKKSQIDILQRRLRGEKVIKTQVVNGKSVEKQEEQWSIEIYTVKYGYTSKSAARSAKGKKKKGMKKIKTMTLFQTVKNRPGLITAYKAGTMGISPKSHVFKMVKKETSNY
jgi:pullulanase/glycogen debranching enzyme